MLLVCVAASRLAPGLVDDPASRLALGCARHPDSDVAGSAAGAALAQYCRCARSRRCADDARGHDCCDRGGAGLRPSVTECGGGVGARVAAWLRLRAVAHETGLSC